MSNETISEVSNVFFMIDKVEEKFLKLKDAHAEHMEQAMAACKSGNLTTDPDSAPFVTKANELVPTIHDVIGHMRFIETGSRVEPEREPEPIKTPEESIALNNSIPTITLKF